jgi:phosphate transporter
MIGRERRGDGDSDLKAIGATLVTEEDASLLQVPTPVGRFKLTRKKIFLVLAIAVFVTLLNVRVLDEVESNRCFAILVFSTIMWATEVHHLFSFYFVSIDRRFPGNSIICDLSASASVTCGTTGYSFARW